MAIRDKYDNDILKTLQKINNNLEKISNGLCDKNKQDPYPQTLLDKLDLKNDANPYSQTVTTKPKSLYIVYGNTYIGEEYGELIHCFGVFNSKTEAERTKDVMEETYYQKNLNDEIKKTYVRRENVEFKIMKIQADKNIDVYLGGYAE